MFRVAGFGNCLAGTVSGGGGREAGESTSWTPISRYDVKHNPHNRAKADCGLHAAPLQIMPMPNRRPASNKRNYIQYHQDGSVWAKGTMVGAQPEG